MSGPLAVSELNGERLGVRFLPPGTDLSTEGLFALAAIGFGTERPAGLALGVPFSTPDLPLLGGEPLIEAWVTNERPTYGSLDGMATASTSTTLFGLLELPESAGASIEDVTYSAYDRIFSVLERTGYSHLLRLWNFFPRITAVEQGLERYQQFSVARHAAFVAHRRTPESAPAASAVGSRGGPFTVLFLAARSAGTPIENPRQVSAYHYPPQYGPRSPTFSRALLARIGGSSRLFLSGTASILGHESVHLGDPGGQIVEALANIDALRDEARKRGFPATGARLFKTYVRDPKNLDMIRTRALERLRPTDRVVFLHAELCRPELLVEIEGVCA